MPAPTLLTPGNLEAVIVDKKVFGPSQDELDKEQPLNYIMETIARKRRSNVSPADRILVLRSSTGSGKSTLLPPEFYHRFFNDDRRDIACTQPRVLTSIEIPTTILPYHTKEALSAANTPNRTPLRLGENIGYQTGERKKRPARGIVYMTIGVLAAQLNVMSDADFSRKYSAIFLDEVHERSTNTDEVMFAMKKYIWRNYMRPECPFLIAMSATFDAPRFAKYLLTAPDEIKDRPKINPFDNIIQVKGATGHPRIFNYSAYDATNFIMAAIDMVAELHESKVADIGPNAPSAQGECIDIMVFVAGAAEIKQMIEGITKLNSRPFFQQYPVLPIQLTGDVVKAHTRDYYMLFDDMSKLHVEVFVQGKTKKVRPSRRVIIATNVAETGITINTLGYVIDTGFFKSSEYNPCAAADMLIVKPVTQSMSIQRAGRVGRIGPGEFFAIYTKETFDKMQENQYPDIIKDEITLNLLSMIIRESAANGRRAAGHNEAAAAEVDLTSDKLDLNKLPIVNLATLDLLDRPSADSIHNSISKLFTLGAIDVNCRPTNVGLIMNRFRFVSIEMIRTILAGYVHGASIIDLVNMAAMLSIGRYVSKLALMPQFAKHFLTGPVLRATDDFIMSIYVFDALVEEITELCVTTAAKKGGNGHLPMEISELDEMKIGGATTTEELDKWVFDRALSLKTMRDIMDLREEIVVMLANNGLNPYENYHKSLHLSKFAIGDSPAHQAAVLAIKKSIFDGHKLNIGVYAGNTYLSRSTHVAFTPSKSPLVAEGGLMEVDPPHYIIYDKLSCDTDRKGQYVITASHICVLDGFINVDAGFDTL